MVVVFSEYLSPLWGFILLGWYVLLLSLVGAVLLLTISLLAVPAAYYFRAVGVLCRCPLFVVSLLL